MLNLPTLEARPQALMFYLHKLIHDLLEFLPIHYIQNLMSTRSALILSKFYLLIVINITSLFFVMLNGNGINYLQKLYMCHPLHFLFYFTQLIVLYISFLSFLFLGTCITLAIYVSYVLCMNY